MNNSLHEFEVLEEPGLESDEIVASCRCGWTGGRHPLEEGGYEEARDEYRMHLAGQLEEVEVPS